MKSQLPLPTARRLSALRGSERGQWNIYKRFRNQVLELYKRLEWEDGPAGEMRDEMLADLKAAEQHLRILMEDWAELRYALREAVRQCKGLRNVALTEEPGMDALAGLLKGILSVVEDKRMLVGAANYGQALLLAGARQMGLTIKADWPGRVGRSPDGAQGSKPFRDYVREAHRRDPDRTKWEIYTEARERCGGTDFLGFKYVKKHTKEVIPGWAPRRRSPVKLNSRSTHCG